MLVKEEIEYLTEDRDRYKELFHQAVKNRDEFVLLADTKQKQCETMSKNYNILYNEKVELQKQVDELKTALADTIKRNEELIEENEQTVKSTAKEICVLLKGFGIDAMLEAIRETYGVER